MSKNTVVTPEQRTQQQEPSPVAVGLGRYDQQNTPRNIGLIIAHEYKKRLTSRVYIISTTVILVLIIIGSFIPTIVKYISATSTAQTKIVVVNNAGSIAGMNNDALLSYINTNLNAPTQGQSTSSPPPYSIQVASADSISSLQSQVKNGSLSILLVLDRSPNQDVQFTYYTNANPNSDPNVSNVQTVAGQLSLLDRSSRLGLTPEQTSRLFAQPQFSVVSVGQAQNKRSTSELLSGIILAYVGVILIFMAVLLYGNGVATGVAEEKGSRIMEILVNAATPYQLMAGKILGIGAAGLTQMTAFVVVGISMLLLQYPIQAALLGSNTGGLNLDITGSSITILLLVLLYFILGFLLYATLYAALGALVKRQDEVQNAVQPLTWLFMVGYIASFFVISAPDATWVKVVSYIPFWTPTTMLVRAAVSYVAWWEIALTVVLMIVAIFICTIIAARIYRFGVLMYGQRPKLGQLIKLARMK